MAPAIKTKQKHGLNYQNQTKKNMAPAIKTKQKNMAPAIKTK